MLEETVDIKWYDGPVQYLSQGVIGNCEFSFISEDNRQISPFFFCKDYLQDAVMGQVRKKKVCQYGYVFDPAVHPPVYLKKTRLLLTNSKDKTMPEKIEACLDFINQFEKKLGINKTKTVVSRCKDPAKKYALCGVWLFEGSNRWMRSPVMISLYSLLLRVGLGHKLGEDCMKTISDIQDGKTKAYYAEVDTHYVKKAKSGIDRILATGDREIFGSKYEPNYKNDISSSILHNNLGIVSFSEGIAVSYMSNWKPEKDKPVKKISKKKTAPVPVV